MLTSTLVQEIMNKYNAIETNPFSISDEETIVQKIKERISRDHTVLNRPVISGRKIEKGEIIFLITNIIILKKQFEMFKIIPIPDSRPITTETMQTFIAINENNYLYPKETNKLNGTHYITTETIIQREPDCVAPGFLHEQIN